MLKERFSSMKRLDAWNFLFYAMSRKDETKNFYYRRRFDHFIPSPIDYVQLPEQFDPPLIWNITRKLYNTVHGYFNSLKVWKSRELIVH